MSREVKVSCEVFSLQLKVSCRDSHVVGGKILKILINSHAFVAVPYLYLIASRGIENENEAVGPIIFKDGCGSMGLRVRINKLSTAPTIPLNVDS
jgi:hypothetical protein